MVGRAYLGCLGFHQFDARAVGSKRLTWRLPLTPVWELLVFRRSGRWGETRGY